MENEFDYDVYMLCPVRNATSDEKEFLEKYKAKLEEMGFEVLYPGTDTVQEDPTGGCKIVFDHCDEILSSRTVHAFYNPKSEGSKYDFGSSFIEHRRRGLDILLMNREDVEEIVKKQKEDGMTKSYEMVLLHFDDIADPSTRIKI